MTADIHHVTALTEISYNFTPHVCHSTMHGIFSLTVYGIGFEEFSPKKAESMNDMHFCYSCGRDSVLILHVEQKLKKNPQAELEWT